MRPRLLGVCVAALLGAIAAGSAAAEQEAGGVTPLTAGSVIQREARTNDVHRYSIELQAGEYLQVDIDQQGVDVAVDLAAPSGESILHIDGPGGENGPEPVAFVAKASGPHGLTVTGGPRPWPPSRYRLQVTALRSPTPMDLVRASAVADDSEGGRLLYSGTTDATRMLELFSRALEGWKQLGEHYMELWTESQIAYLQGQFLDDFRTEDARYRRALAIAQEIGDDFSEAFMSRSVGVSANRAGRLEESEQALTRALALDRAAGRTARVAGDLVSYGSFLTAAGRPQEAVDQLQEALQILAEFPWPGLNRRARLYLADAYIDLGDYEMAVAAYRAVLAEPDVDPRSEALLHRQLGLAHHRSGELDQARADYERAVGLYRKMGKKGEEAATLVRMAILQRDLGELAGAHDTLVAAIPALQASGDSRAETLARCELGETVRRRGELAAARELLESALATLDGRNVPIALCLEQALARVARDADDFREALARATAAVRAVERLRSSAVSPRWRASALAANQEPYDLLIEIHMRQHERDATAGHAEAAFAAAERGRARTLLDLLSEAHVDVREGVGPELRAEERSLRQRLNVQAAALDDALAEGRSARAALIWREVEEVSSRLAEVEAAVRRTSPRYAALTQPEPVTFDALSSGVLDGDTQLVLYALGEKASYAWVASPSGLEAFRLAPRERIEAAARRLRDAVTAGPSRNTGAGADLDAARTALSDLVIAPLARSLARRRLLVVAPDALQYVPFAILTLPGGEDVLARFEVVSAPSASVVATLRGEPPVRPRRANVAIFADPVFERSDPRLSGRLDAPATRVASRGTETDEPVERALAGLRGRGAGGGLGRLPFSRREAEAISALVSGTRAWKATGFEASREAAMSARLADYGIVHFATHGVLNTRRPELSGVVLSLFDERGRKQDGFLRLHDVYNLRLDADLVVLSGCQTALGKDLRGEGLVGLTRGFLYAGARAVVASLWQVDDESTAELMTRFYRGMLEEGRRPPDALRAAQLEMSKSRRWSAPFHWAGFVLQGEWR